MKTNYVFTMLMGFFLLIAGNYCCQTPSDNKSKPESTNNPKERRVIYDFLSDTLTGNNTNWVKQDGRIFVGIRNINLFLYDVTINQDKQSYVDDGANQKTEWRLNIENFDSKSFGQNISNVVFQINDLSENLAFVQDTAKTEQLTPMPGKDTAFYTATFGKSLPTSTLDGGKGDADILKNIRSYINGYPDKLRTLNKDKQILISSQKRIEQAFTYYKELLSSIYSDGVSFEKLKEQREAITNDFLQKKDQNEINKLATILEQITKNQNEIKEHISMLHEGLELLQGILKNIKVSIEQLSSKTERNRIQSRLDIEGSLENLKNIKTSLDDLQNTLNSGVIEQLISNISSVYNSFNPNNFNIHYRLDNLDDYDKIYISTIIKPRTGLSFAKPIRTEEFGTATSTYGGIKFDISSGLCFNIGLNDRQYHYDSLSFKKKDTVLIVKNKNSDSYFPFVCSQMNIYWKPGPHNLGVGFCLGLSSNLSKVRYYFGASLILGKEEKFVLSGGVSGGVIKTLAEDLETGKYYPKKYMPTDPKTTEYFKIGGFLSLTYNLKSKRNKDFGEKFTK